MCLHNNFCLKYHFFKNFDGKWMNMNRNLCGFSKMGGNSPYSSSFKCFLDVLIFLSGEIPVFPGFNTM